MFQSEALYEMDFPLRDEPWTVDVHTGKSYENDTEIFVLIDGAVASSGEDCAAILSALPNAVLVGSNTAGICTFGNVGAIYSPPLGHLRSDSNQYGIPIKNKKVPRRAPPRRFLFSFSGIRCRADGKVLRPPQWQRSGPRARRSGCPCCRRWFGTLRR